MKHKPILLNKIAGQHRGKGREVIGLIGTHHGVGVTYTSLMLAFYMGEELGKKTALLECNEHHDMRLIQKSYQWSQEEAFTFSFYQITCYREVTPPRISEVFGDNYECIIIDFGTDLKTYREEFLRCSTKIVIGGRSEWDRYKLIDFTKASAAICGSETWLYFIPQANNKIIVKIKSEAERKIWSVPITEEPTIPTQNSNRFFDEVFR